MIKSHVPPAMLSIGGRHVKTKEPKKTCNIFSLFTPCSAMEIALPISNRQKNYQASSSDLFYILHSNNNFVNLAAEAGCLGTVTNTFSNRCLVVESNISGFVS